MRLLMQGCLHRLFRDVHAHLRLTDGPTTAPSNKNTRKPIVANSMMITEPGL
jgi:hypothetical protein